MELREGMVGIYIGEAVGGPLIWGSVCPSK